MSLSKIKTKDCCSLLRMRFYQHKINEMLKKSHFKDIPVHLNFGHEAIAVALDTIYNTGDSICLTHRNIVYNMKRTNNFQKVLDSLNLKQSENHLSKMGSMNLAFFESGIKYSSSILGNNLSVACGIAMNKILNKTKSMTYVLLGDGSLEEGAFWEALIFAKSHHLNLMFIVENNDNSMSSSIKQRRSEVILRDVARGLSIPYKAVNGAQILKVQHNMQLLKNEINNVGPVLLECNIKTFNQHAGATPGWASDPKNISLKNGLIIEESEFDPIHNLKLTIGEKNFLEFQSQVMSES